MPRGPSDALRGDRFADWGGRPGAARFGSSAEAAQASSAIPQALSAAADSPATPETSAAAPRAVGARKSRLGSRVAAAIEPRERDAASRLHAAGPTRAAQLFPRAARHPAATSAPADRQDGAATSNPGARFERVRAQLAGTAAAVSAPVFAAEEPRWPELPEWLEPGEADLDAAGRFPREEPERWNALPF